MLNRVQSPRSRCFPQSAHLSISLRLGSKSGLSINLICFGSSCGRVVCVCVRSFAGRLQCLCVISSYELLGSGLETLVLVAGSNPSRPKHSHSFLWVGRGGWNLHQHPSKQEKAQKYSRVHVLPCTHAHQPETHAVNVCSSPTVALSSDSAIQKKANKQNTGEIIRSHTTTHAMTQMHLCINFAHSCWLSRSN